MRVITLIIIHCSAVRPDQTSSAKQIDKWHKARGWKGIGYHYVIRRDGSIEQGRPEWQVGAHCTGHNQHSIGICYEGGLASPPCPSPSGEGSLTNARGKGDNGDCVPADTRTPEQKESMLKLLKELLTRYPGALIVGHNMFARKACPCFDAAKEYEKTLSPLPHNGEGLADARRAGAMKKFSTTPASVHSREL